MQEIKCVPALDPIGYWFGDSGRYDEAYASAADSLTWVEAVESKVACEEKSVGENESEKKNKT